MKTTILEACQVLYRGQSNVKLMANDVGISLEEMQSEFRLYVKGNPLTPDAWQKDVEVSWPYSGN